MTETKNYGFQKPDPADLVDVGVINRNFDKVDEALTPYRINTGKDHDFSYAAGEEENISVLNLTELLGATAAQIIAAFDMGRPVVVSVADSANEFADVSVVLTQKAVYGTITTLTGMAANPLTEHFNTVIRYSLVLTPGEDGSYAVKLQIMDHVASGSGSGSGLTPEQAAQIQANTDAIAALPIAVNADTGYTEIEKLPRATSIDNVLDGDVLTVTSTLQDGRTVPGTMTFDANGYPESYTEEGVACQFSFTGFEQTVKTVELPVVELTADPTTEFADLPAEINSILNAHNAPCIMCFSLSGAKYYIVSIYTPNAAGSPSHHIVIGDSAIVVRKNTATGVWSFALGE